MAVTGSLPDSWGNLESLTTLTLPYLPSVTGTLPGSWGALSQLQTLMLYGFSSTTGSLPADWGNLTSLTTLYLSGFYPTTGSLPSAWQGMTSLTTLTFDSMYVTGSLPASWANMTSLMSIHLQSMYNLVGDIPAEWADPVGGLVNVKALYVNNCPSMALNFTTLGNWFADGRGAQSVTITSTGTEPTLPDALWQAPIRSLSLTSLGLSGTLPAMWGTWAQGPFKMDLLTLSANQLTGTLPASLLDPASSTYQLNLDGNLLSGSLPAAWGSKTAYNMDLSNNRLTGTLPGAWADLMSVSDNDCMCGAVPTWASQPWFSLYYPGTHISYDCLASCDYTFSHPDTRALMALRDAISSFSGAPFNYWLPATYHRPCRVDGSAQPCTYCTPSDADGWCGRAMPDGRFTCLWKGIECANNRVTGIDFDWLDLYGYHLTIDYLPADLANMTSLKTLRLGTRNTIGGTLPAAWADWSSITNVYIGSDGANGATDLHGTLPPDWASWSQIHNFTVVNTQITGTLPSSWTNWTSLLGFQLINAPLEGPLPDEYGASWLALHQLTLASPTLNGSIPTAWLANSSFPSLQALSLDNSIDLLPEYSTLALRLAHNQLNGSLPFAWANWTTLTSLDLSSNSITGSLPPEWSPLVQTSLTLLRLADNTLTGELPVSWAQLGACAMPSANCASNNLALQQLDVSSNGCLCGYVPAWAAVGGVDYQFGNTHLGAPCASPPICSAPFSTVFGVAPAPPPPPPPPPAPTPYWAADATALQSLKANFVQYNRFHYALDTTAALFATWDANVPPCNPNVPACTLCAEDDMGCGTGGLANTCNYKFIRCQTGASGLPRVTEVVLSPFGQLVLSSLPAGMAGLTQLQRLQLDNVNVQGGALPTAWDAWTSLKSFSIGATAGSFAVTGSLPDSWANWQALADMSLPAMPSLTGTLPAAWGGMWQLQTLSILGRVSPAGSLPAGWANMTSLASLRLRDVFTLTGDIPAEWTHPATGMTRLKTLSIANCPNMALNFTTLANWFADGRGAEAVSIANSGTEPTLPDALWQVPIRSLSLTGLGLSGTLPEAWGAWAQGPFKMDILDLSANQLTGALPASLLDPASARFTLALSNNLLGGTLPPAWGSKAAYNIHINNNQLTGTLPPQWAPLVQQTLTSLQLNDNDLVGGLPDAWENPGACIAATPCAANNLALHQLLVNGNGCMCGFLPPWALIGDASIDYLIGSTHLGQLCASPPTCSPPYSLPPYNTLPTPALAPELGPIPAPEADLPVPTAEPAAEPVPALAPAPFDEPSPPPAEAPQPTMAPAAVVAAAYSVSLAAGATRTAGDPLPISITSASGPGAGNGAPASFTITLTTATTTATLGAVSAPYGQKLLSYVVAASQVTRAGSYSVSFMDGPVHLQGSPLPVIISPGPVSIAASRLVLPNSRPAGQAYHPGDALQVQARLLDQYGNVNASAALQAPILKVTAGKAGSSSTPMLLQSNGTFTANYTFIKAADTAAVSATYLGASLAILPSNMTTYAAVVDSTIGATLVSPSAVLNHPSLAALTQSTTPLQSGLNQTLLLPAVDAFGNTATQPVGLVVMMGLQLTSTPFGRRRTLLQQLALPAFDYTFLGVWSAPDLAYKLTWNLPVPGAYQVTVTPSLQDVLASLGIPPDMVPPVISMAGALRRNVNQLDAVGLLDGVAVSDNVDVLASPNVTLALCSQAGAAYQGCGRVALPAGATTLNTTLPTPAGQMYVLNYTAQDSSGNQAVPRYREVVVSSPCQAPEFLCVGSTTAGQCSKFQLCIQPAGSAGGSQAAAPYVPPKYTVAPVIKLLGSGQLARTPLGAYITLDNVTVGTRWSDPGVIATSAVDGDITGLVSSFGVGGVVTSAPTPPGQPYLITYDVTDSTPLAAMTAGRRVSVVCPAKETICDDGSGKLSCSWNGICGAAPSSTAASAVVDMPPVIKLIGPASMIVAQGSAYAKCPPSAPLSAICERGCEATDDMDGVLTARVEACSSGPDKRYLFSKLGLAGCGLDTSKPGVRNITFSVQDSKGQTVSVNRTITIQKTCPPGEHLCSNQVDCSEGGTCVSDLQAGSPSKPKANSPPTIALMLATALPAVVSVKRGILYGVCAAGQQPTADLPCELGVTASDSEDGDRTAQVLSCPPAACLAQGCPGHEFRVKGLQGCGLDKMASIGQSIPITFMVFDTGVPPLNASMTRTVTIAPPCASGQSFCLKTGSTIDHFCSQVPCDQLHLIAAAPVGPPPAPPLLTLLHADSTNTSIVTYGSQASFSLLPCASTQQTSCGAFATDAQEGDISKYIQVTDVTPCSTASSNAGQCLACDPGTATQGVCLPGNYTYMYTVANQDGVVATAMRSLLITQTGVLSSSVNLNSGATSLAAAQEDALALLQPNSTANAIFRTATAAIVSNSTGVRVALSNVTITSVETLPAGNGQFKLAVTFTVDVAYTSGPSATGNRRRRRLLASGDGLSNAGDGINTASRGNGYDAAMADAAASYNTTAPYNATGDGASVNTTQTSPALDVQTGQLASLLAQVVNLQIRQSLLTSELATLANATDASQGAALDAALTQRDKDLTQEFTALLADATTSYSNDQANATQLLALFQQTLNAQQAIVAMTNNALSALKDRVASQQAFLSNLARTQAFLNDLIGVVTQAPCNRMTGSSQISFIINSSSPAANGAASPRRQLLADATGASGPDVVLASTQRGYYTDMFAGYLVTEGNPNSIDLRLATERVRYVGVSGNVVIGGLLLHQTRQTLYSACTSRQQDLDFRCQELAIYAALNDTDSTRFISELQRQRLSSKLPFGVDPVFLQQSSLYDNSLAGAEADYYNVSAGSPEASAIGTPFAFYQRDLPGWPTGFPVVVENQLSATRAGDIITYLQDGNYLDAQTQHLTATLVTYNVELRVWGYFRIDFDWGTDGTVRSKSQFFGLPAMHYSFSGSAGRLQLLRDIILLPITVAVFVWMKANIWFRRRHLVAKQSDARLAGWAGRIERWLRNGQIMFDVVLAAVMMAAVCLYIAYIVQQSHFTAASSYEIYDAQQFARARWMLPKKANTTVTAAPGNVTAAPGNVTAAAPQPGDRGRWQLDDDPKGLDQFSSDVAHINRMAALYSQYSFLQALVLMTLIFKCVSMWSFQAHIGLITRTLGRAVPELAHFFAVFLPCIIIYGMLAVIAFGERFVETSTMSRSIPFVFEYLVSQNAPAAGFIAYDGSVNTGEMLMTVLFYFAMPFFLMFTLLNFLLGALMEVFSKEKKQVLESTPGTLEDLLAMLRHWKAVHRDKALSNFQLLKLVLYLKLHTVHMADQAEEVAGMSVTTVLAEISPDDETLKGLRLSARDVLDAQAIETLLVDLRVRLAAKAAEEARRRVLTQGRWKRVLRASQISGWFAKVKHKGGGAASPLQTSIRSQPKPPGSGSAPGSDDSGDEAAGRVGSAIPRALARHKSILKRQSSVTDQHTAAGAGAPDAQAGQTGAALSDVVLSLAADESPGSPDAPRQLPASPSQPAPRRKALSIADAVVAARTGIGSRHLPSRQPSMASQSSFGPGSRALSRHGSILKRDGSLKSQGSTNFELALDTMHLVDTLLARLGDDILRQNEALEWQRGWQAELQAMLDSINALIIQAGGQAELKHLPASQYTPPVAQTPGAAASPPLSPRTSTEPAAKQVGTKAAMPESAIASPVRTAPDTALSSSPSQRPRQAETASALPAGSLRTRSAAEKDVAALLSSSPARLETDDLDPLESPGMQAGPSAFAVSPTSLGHSMGSTDHEAHGSEPIDGGVDIFRSTIGELPLPDIALGATALGRAATGGHGWWHNTMFNNDEAEGGGHEPANHDEEEQR
ncbi:hypothetical protein WJX72_008548 [[Myrmecia] bisecta]|uniref:Polycystin cation channel PKD1/PKD2 domain-containing protein n=1 Tax=[Myrmecia] bisecta TaxID=41462 RepID=A0AAW1P9X6_9CHLO